MDAKAATDLSRRLNSAGFLALGGFHPARPDAPLSGATPCAGYPGDGRQPDRYPPGEDGRPGATLILVGNAGDALWRAFSCAPEAGDGGPDPLDRYTRRVLVAIAGDFALAPVFSFERPYWPFQRWALAAGGFSQSPMGALAHHRYGPWAGLRAAFVSSEWFGHFEDNGAPGPCPACVEKPCIAACPAEALSRGGYDVPRCAHYLEKTPQAACLRGCLARVACPHGTAYRQAPEQARFHMRAFIDWNDWA